MEAEAGLPLEQALAALEGVERTTTQCERGRCVVRLTLVTESDLATVRDGVQAGLLELGALAEASEVSVRPVRTQDSHIVLQLEPAADTSSHAAALRRVAETIVAPQLEQQRGVAHVTIRGGRRPQCIVLFDPPRLAAFNVTPLELAEALGSKSLRPEGVGAPTADDVREAVVTTREGKPVLVRDLAVVRIELTAPEPGTGARVSLLVTMQPGTSVRTLQTSIATLQGQLPVGVRLRAVPSTRPTLVVWLAAPEPQQVRPLIERARALVLKVPGVESAAAQATMDDPEVVVELRHERAARLGITNAQVEATMETLVGRTVGTVNHDGDPVRLVVRAGEHRSQGLAGLKHLRIRGQNGSVLPLSSVVNARLVHPPGELLRLGTNRAALIRIRMAEDADTERVVAAVREAVAGLHAEVDLEWNERAGRR